MIRVIADTQHISQHWERRSDELPYLMVRMSDGKTIRYNPEIPHPGFVKSMENLENLRIGYPIGKKEDKDESTV